MGLLDGSLDIAAQATATRFGLNLTIIDISWPAASAIACGTSMGALFIPIAIGINVVLLIFVLPRRSTSASGASGIPPLLGLWLLLLPTMCYLVSLSGVCRADVYAYFLLGPFAVQLLVCIPPLTGIFTPLIIHRGFFIRKHAKLNIIGCEVCYPELLGLILRRASFRIACVEVWSQELF